MNDRFTYFEFQMYLLPGALAVAFLGAAVLIILPPSADMLQADVLGSVVFVLLSYIAGNFVQAIAHGKPERKLKKQYWDGALPSQVMFFVGNAIIDEWTRERLIARCLQLDLLTPAEAASLAADDRTDPMIAKAQSAFEVLWVRAAAGPRSRRIESAEAHYQLFRGLFVAAACGALLAGAAAAARLAMMGFPGPPATAQPATAGIVGAVLSLIGVVLWRVFRWRCRGAAQGFAREVARAATALDDSPAHEGATAQ